MTARVAKEIRYSLLHSQTKCTANTVCTFHVQSSTKSNIQTVNGPAVQRQQLMDMDLLYKMSASHNTTEASRKIKHFSATFHPSIQATDAWWLIGLRLHSHSVT